MAFKFDLQQFLYTLRTNRELQILILVVAGFIVFLLVIDLKNSAEEGECQKCNKYHVYREANSVKTGTESEYKDEWDYTENKWKRVYRTTTSYMTTFKCSNCSYSGTFPTFSTKTRDAY